MLCQKSANSFPTNKREQTRVSFALFYYAKNMININ